jgi:hypothetical protein
MSATPTTCSQCRQTIDTSADCADGPRRPCPACGATQRTIHAGITDLASKPAELNLSYRARSLAKRKRTPASPPRHAREQQFVLAPSADGVRRRVLRIFDRDADHYEELVIDDDSGELVRLIVEPLSCHVGRGSAKYNTYKTAIEWALSTLASGAKPPNY